MAKRLKDKIFPAHAFCLINPKGRIVPSTCNISRIDCWESRYTQDEWVKMQREGWGLRRVLITVQYEDKVPGRKVSKMREE